MRLSILAVFAFLALTDQAAAVEARTYAGTIGKLPVIVELADAGEDGAFVGRYAYLAKAIDIPLHGTNKSDLGGMVLEEEKACSEDLCKVKGELIDVAPIAAIWTLKVDGRGLSGTWRDKANGKSHPVKLLLKAERTLPDNGMTGLAALDPSYGDDVLTPALLPYDFLKMDWPLSKGEITAIGDSAYRMDEDNRTGIAFPSVLKLGSTNPARLNAYLLQERLQYSMNSFWCLSKAYLGFDWGSYGGEGTAGFGDGDTSVIVYHLTSRLMQFSEGGSFYCGGAYPNNSWNLQMVDARTGTPLVAEHLLKGWVAKSADGVVVDPKTVVDQSKLTFGPDDALVKFIEDHLDPAIDAATKSDCGIDDLIHSNLAVYFTTTEMIFTFQGLRHQIFACTNDLAKVPLKDARPFLTDAGAAYFAVLDR
jgi:hypothetical protein